MTSEHSLYSTFSPLYETAWPRNESHSAQSFSLDTSWRIFDDLWEHDSPSAPPQHVTGTCDAVSGLCEAESRSSVACDDAFSMPCNAALRQAQPSHGQTAVLAPPLSRSTPSGVRQGRRPQRQRRPGEVVAERRRSLRLQEAFLSLCRCLPAPSPVEGRRSKAKTLRLAAAYIADLRSHLQRLDSETATSISDLSGSSEVSAQRERAKGGGQRALGDARWALQLCSRSPLAFHLRLSFRRALAPPSDRSHTHGIARATLWRLSAASLAVTHRLSDRPLTGWRLPSRRPCNPGSTSRRLLIASMMLDFGRHQAATDCSRHVRDS